MGTELIAGDETLGILEEIQSLVYDTLQVVSYKWLSRNFSLSSNDAKKLLEDFVEKYGKELQVVYTLSGWLKGNPPAYHIKLVPGTKLSDAKQEFKESYSVQVYSIQVSIPKDPAVLWSAEFAQAEGLFDQPLSVNNCLRDNRFCGITNAFVKRSLEGKTSAIAPVLPKNGFGAHVSSRTNGVLPDASRQHQEQKFAVQSSSVATPSGKTVSAAAEINSETSKPNINMERVLLNKTKVHNEKTLPASGSLANMWGRASAKIKSSTPAIGSIDDAVTSTVAPSHTSSCGASDAVNSDDDECVINFKRETNGGSGRKRKVVFDFSDDEDGEDDASLASPEAPNNQLDCVNNDGHLVTEKELANSEENKSDMVCREQVKIANSFEQLVKGDLVGAIIDGNARSLETELETSVPMGHLNKIEKNEATNQLPSLPKRKKVLNTRIDERGREVTEVVWEGKLAEACNALKDSPNDGMENSCRPPMPTKTPASSTIATGKAGNRKTGKGGVKDAKQGNIFSFFKKI